jgi:hypothetical protein
MTEQADSANSQTPSEPTCALASMALRARRQQCVDDYHQATRNQRQWYSQKANRNQWWFRFFGIATVVLGAVVGLLPAFKLESDWPFAVLGALIVILKGMERLWLPEEKWIGYRKAAEAMQREQERFVFGLAPYHRFDDEDAVFRLFVDRCDRIKSEEQKNFWNVQEQSAGERAEKGAESEGKGQP